MSITSNPAFNASTTSEEVASALSSFIAGRTILVTGAAPGGLGAQFAKAVAAHQPKLVILAGHRGPKLAETAEEIKSVHPGVATRTLELDLVSQAQVRKAAAEVLSWPEPLDVLVNNAGIMAIPYGKTVDGIEQQFGTNYIGHFLFTNLVMSKLLASSKGPRVVTVSSDGHRLSDIRWDDLDFQDGKVYNKWMAYGQSKTASILFSVELARKLGSKGLKAFSLHPGPIMTNLGRFIDPDDFAALNALDKALGNKEAEGVEYSWKSISQGTATHVVAAFDPKLDGYNGAYLQDCQRAPDEDTKAYALEQESAARLWKVSEKLVDQTFCY
ncbi:NAD(P)-binding protein [Lentinus tigrinus ALCF2SS1-7]|uniref:NAD(P)-binding protein n=1 Tax=Lentinus tigrinus ALCF2SS1-6 TaxID=1328759 RepID=A0A5C2RUI3_9APHY|nr:NAD(P)-binding protein [Lentinus tigrinus ALCF2SS1-6]RPD69286.1 NAD(P)-binding protein [Lentinus tigrinus ALCF2SS1-7]